jgi:hypothetical protein
VFKISSIKQLLQLWSVGTVLAIVLIAAGGIYTNILFSATQQELTEKVIPVGSLSRDISNLATVLATREKQLLVSNLLDTPAADVPRHQLEQQFSSHWENLLVSIEDKEAKQVAEHLSKDYQYFLNVDDRLLKSIAEHQAIMVAIEKSVSHIESAQNQAAAAFVLLAKQGQMGSADTIIAPTPYTAAYQTLVLGVL